MTSNDRNDPNIQGNAVHMRRFVVLFLLAVFLAACTNSSAPPKAALVRLNDPQLQLFFEWSRRKHLEEIVEYQGQRIQALENLLRDRDYQLDRRAN